jgi:acyl-coenzyme A synthetase/AMP-(fatty) acid ligase
VKVGGEAVDLNRLDRILEGLAGARATVVAVADARLGHVIHLVVEEGVTGSELREAYDAAVFPFERARGLHVLPSLPRTELGKVRKGEVLRAIGITE